FAQATGACREAMSLITKSLALLEQLAASPERDERELTLHMTLASVVRITRGYAEPALERILLRALEVCARLDAQAERLYAVFGLYSFHLIRGNLLQASAFAAETLSLAEQLNQAEFLQEAHFAVGSVLLFQGKFARSWRHCEESL